MELTWPRPHAAAVCCVQVELTGSGVFDYIHPGDHVEMAEQLGMKVPPGRAASLAQGAANEDAASSASSSSHPETPEPGKESQGLPGRNLHGPHFHRRAPPSLSYSLSVSLSLCFFASLSLPLSFFSLPLSSFYLSLPLSFSLPPFC